MEAARERSHDIRRLTPSRAGMEDFYVRNEPFFDAFGSEEGFDCCGYWMEGTPRPSNYQSKLNLYQEILNLLALQSGDLALDAGCGLGEPARMVSHHTGAKLFGLDIQMRRLRRFEDRGRFPSARASYLQGDGVALPFTSNLFDAMYSNECLLHFSSRQSYFEEAMRVLKPGGRLVVTDYVLGKEGAPRWMTEWIRYHFYTPEMFTADRSHQLASECGFIVGSTRDITGAVFRAHRIAALSMLRGRRRIAQFLAGPRIYFEGTLFLLLAPWLADRSVVRFQMMLFQKPEG